MGKLSDFNNQVHKGDVGGMSYQDYHQLLAQQKLDGLTRPADISYNPSYNNSMAMGPEMDSRLNAMAMDNRGLDAFRNEALRTGPSAWAHMAHADQNQQILQNRDQAMRQASGTAAQSQAQLAMQGGLSSGARERIAQNASNNAMAMQQDVTRTGMNNNAQIGLNDEQNRVQQLSMVPGMEATKAGIDLQKNAQWAGAKQFDTQNQITEGGRHNAFDLSMWDRRMQEWGSNKTADATEHSGK